MTSDNNIWVEARDLVANGQTARSLALLQEHAGSLPHDATNELILFQARLSQLEKTERLIGQDVSIERQRLNKAVLDFIQLHENTPVAPAHQPLATTSIVQQRIQRLQQKILETYDLIEQWEQKRTLSENPTEQKRCDLEINRLRGILDQYLPELEALSGRL